MTPDACVPPHARDQIPETDTPWRELTRAPENGTCVRIRWLDGPQRRGSPDPTAAGWGLRATLPGCAAANLGTAVASLRAAWDVDEAWGAEYLAGSLFQIPASLNVALRRHSRGGQLIGGICSEGSRDHGMRMPRDIGAVRPRLTVEQIVALKEQDDVRDIAGNVYHVHQLVDGKKGESLALLARWSTRDQVWNYCVAQVEDLMTSYTAA